MSDRRDPPSRDHDEEIPSLEQVARLDTFLDDLVAGRGSEPRDLSPQELREHMLAAQLRGAHTDEARPGADFLRSLEAQVASAVATERAGAAGGRRPARLSRGRFLRSAATFAGGVGLGIAGAEGAAAAQDAQRPHDLIVAGNERWYAIAREGEVPPGGMKAFSAGGLLGFLLNDGGRLHAVSAICTHMGCRLKPDGAEGASFHCLCHGSRFSRRGEVKHGLAPSSLPAIAVRVEAGIVYALGTRESM